MQTEPFPAEVSDGENFESDTPDYRRTADDLVLSLDGFEGPIDLLLTLAREHKLDITRISILALAEQYLAFIERARALRLEIAADYLVMAAWLAYLKSRLLLPTAADEDGEDPAEMAARLALQLQRLDAMRRAAENLFERPQLDRDFFRRGMPEEPEVDQVTTFRVTLYDLLNAYGRIKRRSTEPTLRIAATALFSLDEAVQRLRRVLGDIPDWSSLERFLPPHLADDPLLRRSAVASTLAASLELAREGLVEIRQTGMFAPIFMRRARPVAVAGDAGAGEQGEE